MTQEFHISVTPLGGDRYLVRTERVERGVHLAEEQVTWNVDAWLAQATVLMNDPLLGLLRGDTLPSLNGHSPPPTGTDRPLSANLVTLGQQLYNALFQGTIRERWITARGIAQNRQEVLRLRLGLKDSRLAQLPWEVLHEGDRAIATGTEVAFSRYHCEHTSFTPILEFQAGPSEVEQPLKILMVLAAPGDQAALQLRQEALQLRQELENLLQTSDPAHRAAIELTLLEQPDRQQLTEILDHNRFQVFHYAGHSDPGGAGGSLYLVNRKTGLTETLNGEDLAGLLVNSGIRLAVFNSCRGMYTGVEAIAAGTVGNLAEALVKRDIPAVLAMAERIPDDVALNLSRWFYRSLMQTRSIDSSLNRARQGLVATYGSKQLYWALPILYLHPQFNGYLLAGMNGTDRPVDPLEPTALTDLARSTLPQSTLPQSPLPQSPLTVDDFVYEDFDPEALEFDDPDYQETLESTVAQLVQQLSQSGMPSEPPQTIAPPVNDRLPSADPNPAASFPRESAAAPVAIAPTTSLAPTETATQTATQTATTIDAAVCTELERVLEESGKSIVEISPFIQAVQRQPEDAVAYDRLGSALFQQGYLPEAIAAFQQAIQLNPYLSEAHHHLGLVLLEQNNVLPAIRSLSQSVQLSPTSAEAQHHLTIALRKQGVTTADPAALPLEPTTPDRQPAHRPRVRRQRTGDQTLLWIASAAIGLSTLMLGGWFIREKIVRPSVPLAIILDNASDLSKISTNTVAALATEQLNQGNLGAAQRAIESLLDRGALVEATAVLTPVLNRYTGNGTVNFLMGRLTWQQVRSGNKDYSLDDARRYWEKAAEQQINPKYQNALAVAYYETGDLDRAQRAWRRSLELLGSDSRTAPTSQEALDAQAGTAIALVQSAENQPPSRRASLLSEATQLRQQVLTRDPVNFQPDALSKNWLWSAKAIRDWRSLLSVK